MSAPSSGRHIAVVVVHGVGYRPPNESASEVAHLLLRLSPDPDTPPDGVLAHYPAFREEPLDFALHPLAAVPDPGGAVNAPRTQGRFEERAARVAQCVHGPPAPAGTAPVETSELMMGVLLEGYVPDPSDRICESARLAGERQTAGAPPSAVHVYEVYWSDISKLGSSVIGIFAAFYDLVIHAPYLGLQSLDYARVADRDALSQRSWTLWSGVYRLALRLFSAVIPTLTLLMVALALAILPVTLRDDLRQLLTAVIPALAAAGAVFVVQLQRRATLTRGVALTSLAAGGAVAALAWWQWTALLAPVVMLAEWWVMAGLLLYPLFSAFERERRGVLATGIAGYAMLTLLLIVFAVSHAREEGPALRATLATVGRVDGAAIHALGERTALFTILNAFEWIFVALIVAWIAFMIAFLAMAALAWILTVRRPTDPPRAAAVRRLRQVTFTARLALAGPAVVFAFATYVAWSAYYHGAAKQLLPNEYAYVPQLDFPALDMHRTPTDSMRCPSALAPAQVLAAPPSGHCSARNFPDAFDGGSTTEMGLASAMLILFAIGLVLWAALPSGFTEYASPASVPPSTTPRAPGDAQARQAMALGSWLTTGFGLGRIALDLITIAFVMALVSTVLTLPIHTATFTTLRDMLAPAPRLLQSLSLTKLLVTSGSAIGALAVMQRFGAIGRGLRPVLGVGLDIANYLREFPRTRTPRARIIERYTSLLRVLCQWRAPDGHGYDAIVIVAHSQGTVITADLLRYLERVRASGGEPQLAKLNAAPTAASPGIPLYLFTMGSPLLQLYARRFPHLYDWANAANPADLLGVRHWVNVYRSGDYVGRSLWAEASPSAFTPGTVLLDDGTRREYCIGAGAHTHYWDGTASAVGMELDRLIALALRETATIKSAIETRKAY
ncbi:MAG: hypothetical protein ABJD07_12665 [Gemmatimonadaceae bacterium]